MPSVTQLSMSGHPLHSVASELLVNDRTLVLPAPPLSIATVGDVVWIAMSDGKVEVRNTRTGEVVRRFEPFVSTAASAGQGIGTVGSLLSMVNRGTSSSAIGVGGTAGVSASIKRSHKGGGAGFSEGTAPIHVRAVLAVVTADGEPYIWMGLSNGCIEVHDGGSFPKTAARGDAVRSMPVKRSNANGLVTVLRRHTLAVTSLAEFGGYVYSGSEDRQILQWRASNSIHTRLFSSNCPHEKAVRCLLAEGNALVSGSDDCTVKVWDVGEGTMRLTGYFHSQSGGVLSLCRVGEHIWSGDASGHVVRWLLRTCEAAGLHTPHRDRVLSLRHVGDRVYSGSADGTMGIFNAANGQLLQHITDQSLGWVTAIECPAELSRFVVWSASADGAVRCWYQDEYVDMTADEVRFNDEAWYISGSTPYREFRAAVGQRTLRLKQQLSAIEHRDKHAMSMLRCCSTVFGGGGSELEAQQQKLQEQLASMEERCRKAEERVAVKRKSVADVDRDIAASLALLQSTRSELNQLKPGEAERVLATLPALTTEDILAYTPTPAASLLELAGKAPVSNATTTGATTAPGVTVVPGGTAVPGAATLPPGPSVVLPSTGTSAAAGIQAPPQPPVAYATSTTIPSGPPIPLGPVPPPPLPAIPPPPSSAVSVPSTVIPPPPPGVVLPAGTASSVPPAAVPASSLGVGGPLIPPPSSAVPPPQVTGTLLPSSGATAPSSATAAPSGLTSTIDGANSATGNAAVAAGGQVGDSVTGKAMAASGGSMNDDIKWTNPHVGNYIQRRYYGATPSLRTIDLMKQERRRGSLPRIKVEALQRGRSYSASPHRETQSSTATTSTKVVTSTVTISTKMQSTVQTAKASS